MSPVDLRMFVSTLFINITMATFAPKLPTSSCFVAILVPCLPWLSRFLMSTALVALGFFIFQILILQTHHTR